MRFGAGIKMTTYTSKRPFARWRHALYNYQNDLPIFFCQIIRGIYLYSYFRKRIKIWIRKKMWKSLWLYVSCCAIGLFVRRELNAFFISDFVWSTNLKNQLATLRTFLSGNTKILVRSLKSHLPSSRS